MAARCPSSAAKHLVLVAEEDLGVLRIRKRLESGVSDEVGARPLPDVAQHLNRAALRGTVAVGARGCETEGELVEVGPIAAGTGGRRLPFRLRRQALPRPAGECLGLVP